MPGIKRPHLLLTAVLSFVVSGCQGQASEPNRYEVIKYSEHDAELRVWRLDRKTGEVCIIVFSRAGLGGEERANLIACMGRNLAIPDNSEFSQEMRRWGGGL